MKERGSVNFIAIILYITILILLSLMIALGVHIYKEEFSNVKEEIETIDSFGNNQIIITSNLPEENETPQIVSIDISKANQNVNIQNNIDKFYYNQLDDYSKAIYNCLENQKENLKTGTATIEMPAEIEELVKTEEGAESIEGEFTVAVNAFEYDNPDIFYLDYSKMALYYEIDSLGNCIAYIKNYEGNANYLIEGFNSKEDVENAEDQINTIIEGIENEANNLQSNYDKIKYVHDWIIKNTIYDETLSMNNRNNIYGVIIEKNATCGGYAKTFKYIMDKLNINSIIIQGEANQYGSNEYHAWNIVQLDGNWYGVDCTWDDPIVQGIESEDQKPIYYDYFLKGQNSFERHYSFDTFYGTDLEIEYPEMSTNNY